MIESSIVGPTFRKSFLLIVLVELISFALFYLKDVADARLYFFIFLFCFLIILGLYQFKWLVFVAIAELVIGSKGHLFSIDINGFVVSIRLAIFISVMLSWLIMIDKKEFFRAIVVTFRQNKFLFWLAVVGTFSLVFAFLARTPVKNIFFDLNGWLFFAYLFPWSQALKTKGDLKDVLAVLFSAAMAVTAKTLIFLYVLSHKMPLAIDLYRWGRNTLWGEFTFVEGGLSRVFSQSQIYVVIIFLICASVFFLKIKISFKNKNTRFFAWLMIWFSSVIIVGLSRSFWLGLAAAIVIFIFSIRFFCHFSFKRQATVIFSMTVAIIIGYGLMNAIINFPFPKTDGFYDSTALIAKRFSEDEAIASRWSQLPELKKIIFQHPIIGSGWGKSITYFSSDPRVKTIINPTGKFTTFTFEWGYLDMIIKIGAVGLIVYVLLLCSILKRIKTLTKKNSGTEESALLAGLGFGVIIIAVVHFFSPYLNHPLGIGYVILTIVIIKIMNDDVTNAESRP
ncbi:hypothetical protein HZB94_02710 [Candidatus Falkowbacteria bacterium]|nr:hypothetical protein [Candidatus Falkowbacteria bacterium]